MKIERLIWVGLNMAFGQTGCFASYGLPVLRVQDLHAGQSSALHGSEFQSFNVAVGYSKREFSKSQSGSHLRISMSEVMVVILLIVAGESWG